MYSKAILIRNITENIWYFDNIDNLTQAVYSSDINNIMPNCKNYLKR